MAKVNGVEINLKPSKAMKAEAERFLQWRRDGIKGGTDVAYRRARQIANNAEMQASVVIAMRAWKARHMVDRKAEGFNPGEKGYPSKGRVAAAAWGLPGGDKWVDQKGAAIERARKLSVDRATPSMESLKFDATEASRSGDIDLEAGTIKGVSLISTPEAKGHGMSIDQKSIESFYSAVDGKTIKAYYTHNDNEAFDTIGLWANFEVIEDNGETKLTGDFEALESWKENKKEEYDALFELAEKAPEAFGVSAEFTGTKVFYNEDDEEIEYAGQEEPGKLFARASEVQAFSIVATPAANPTGLFTEGTEQPEEQSLSAAISDIAEQKQQLESELKLAQDQLQVFEANLQDRESHLLEVVAELEKAKQETDQWKIKYAQMAAMGSDPVEATAEATAPKSFEEKLAACSTAQEKLELFKQNNHIMTDWQNLK